MNITLALQTGGFKAQEGDITKRDVKGLNDHHFNINQIKSMN